MIRIGEKAFPFGSPAVINGELVYLHPEHLKGRWVALCFVPHLGFIELDHQGKVFAEAGGLLLAVPVGTPLVTLLSAGVCRSGEFRHPGAIPSVACSGCMAARSS